MGYVIIYIGILGCRNKVLIKKIRKITMTKKSSSKIVINPKIL